MRGYSYGAAFENRRKTMRKKRERNYLGIIVHKTEMEETGSERYGCRETRIRHVQVHTERRSQVGT